MPLSNAHHVNAAEFLLGALESFGLDKSAACDIVDLASKALEYAEQTEAYDYNPEAANHYGAQHGVTMQEQRKHSALVAIADPNDDRINGTDASREPFGQV